MIIKQQQGIGSLMGPAHGNHGSDGAGGEAGQSSQVLDSAKVGSRGGQVRRNYSFYIKNMHGYF
jgi:hypothetical protein